MFCGFFCLNQYSFSSFDIFLSFCPISFFHLISFLLSSFEHISDFDVFVPSCLSALSVLSFMTFMSFFVLCLYSPPCTFLSQCLFYTCVLVTFTALRSLFAP